ncbi:MAG: 4Fe-4S ferredoxin, partial [Armatimonadota bacterium]
MPKTVYFANLRAAGRTPGLLDKAAQLFDKAGFARIIRNDDLVAVKIHFGEPGNTGFLRPVYVR